MGIKRDYMRNNQLLLAYNMQVAVCDEYIATFDINQYLSHMDCFVPLMEKYIKFTIFEKETNNQEYRNNSYRATNFIQDEQGTLMYPKGRRFKFKQEQHIKGNKYGRTEEIYECNNYKHKHDCYPKVKNNRAIRINLELTSIHEKVLKKLCSIQRALLCMNRSIQVEGTF